MLFSKNKSNMEDCTICLEEIKESITLKCSHSFCYNCIDEWYKQKQTCPLCRKKIGKKDIKRKWNLKNLKSKMKNKLRKIKDLYRTNKCDFFIRAISSVGIVAMGTGFLLLGISTGSVVIIIGAGLCFALPLYLFNL